MKKKWLAEFWIPPEKKDEPKKDEPKKFCPPYCQRRCRCRSCRRSCRRRIQWSGRMSGCNIAPSIQPSTGKKDMYLIERADDGRWHMALVKEMFGFHLRYVKEINFEVLQRPIDEAPPTQQPKVVKAKFPMCEPRPPVRVPPIRRP